VCPPHLPLPDRDSEFLSSAHPLAGPAFNFPAPEIPEDEAEAVAVVAVADGALTITPHNTLYSATNSKNSLLSHVFKLLIM
jgi:hypothetical protein